MKIDLSKTTPFLQTGGNPEVYVTSGCGPYENTRKALRSIDLSVVRGKGVLLKPNAGRIAAPEAAVTTHPEVVAAAIDAFIEAGAVVSVGESPIAGVKTIEALEACGIAAVVRERDCSLIDMDERRFVSVDIPGGLAIQELKVCPDVLEHDIVVSIPVMKMHMHTGVTLSIKNMKGCLWRRSKIDLHMLPPVAGCEDDKSLNIAIADMASVLSPHLAIIDGNFGMEGMGPSAGGVRELGAVVVGINPFAADAVACTLMGVDSSDVPHLKMAAERGFGITDTERINVTPENWRDLAVPFAPPPESMDIQFPGVKVLDKNSCSACQSTLLMFLQRYGEKLGDYFPEKELVNIAIGKGHEDLPMGTLCVGNCTRMHKDKGLFVSGCPPVPSEILNVIEKFRKN